MRQTLRNMGRKKWLSWLINGLVLLSIVYGVEIYRSQNIYRGPLPDSLRTRSLPSPSGTTHSLWSPGQYTLLYVFAPWCGVCKLSVDNIKRLPRWRFQMATLALSWGEAAEVKEFATMHDIKVPVLMGGEEVRSTLGIDAFPSYLVIDKKGQVVMAWSGYTTTLGLWFKIYIARIFF